MHLCSVAPCAPGVGCASTAKVYTLTHHFYVLIYVVWTLLGARESLLHQ